ncbi:hypothetical protein [Lysinibacillus fusiformis]|uniref:hypothetical protein n=1 Tax=Lysinibacillus fusiformis TaxID=28031 RepID=UPI0023A9F019|nr:hypothetical protein [Lysinibacillus fusiformis]WEA41772.1 hypothetical protein PWJ66_23720 [Lysinibacillus fusiformis]
MENFIATMTNLLTWLQMPSLILAAIAICVAGYFWKLGGQDGRRIAKTILIGAGVGLLLVNGALALATSVNTNITF